MGLFNRKKSNFDWKPLDRIEQLEELEQESHNHLVLLFKHSTRCSISLMAKNRIESGWEYRTDEIVPYYLDLLQYRSISNAISERFGIVHQSPQIIVLKAGKVVHQASHSAIQPTALRSIIS